MRAVLVALALAGCGRVSFESGPAATGDARSDADPSGPDASTLVSCPPSTTPAVATIKGRTFRYTSFSNTWAAVPSTTVTARTDVEGVILAQTVSGAVDGGYTLDVPLPSGPRKVVLDLAAGGTYFRTFIHLDRPLDASITAPALTTNDVYSLGDGPVWNAAGVQLIYDQVALTRDTARGTLNIAVSDCSGNPVDGVTIELTPPSQLLRYQAPDGTASATLTSTVGPFGHALAFNSPSGLTRIVARKGGVIVADLTIDVADGSEITQAIVRAAN